MPDPTIRKNYRLQKRVQRQAIATAIFVALAISALPLVLLRATVSAYDEDCVFASLLVTLIFGGVSLAILAAIWCYAFASIGKSFRVLASLKEEYRRRLSSEESATLDRRKRSRRILAWSLVGVTLAGFIAVSAVSRVHTSRAYEEAVLLADSGLYEEAAALFESIEDKDYLDTDAYISLCKAHIYYGKGDISAAFSSMEYVRFYYLTEAQSQAVDNFAETLDTEYESYSRAKAAAEEKAYRARIAKGVPYVGMSESNIGNTSLGAPSGTVRHNYECIGGKQYKANLYDFKQGNKTVFTARCVRGTVTEVWDSRDASTPSYTHKKNSWSAQDDDPYNVNDFASEEDFYDEHYDDFFDYEDAEDYYNEHHN